MRLETPVKETRSTQTFATLRVRFHNQFLSRTADELWDRLHTTKRQRGESVEEWGDRVTDLCDSLDYPNPQMRYKLFRRGLRNRRMLAALDSSPARDIPEACEWLMSKDMHRPSEEDEEFSDGAPESNRNGHSSSAVDALTQQLQTFMAQQQLWQQQLMDVRKARPSSPRGRSSTVAATTAGNAPATGDGKRSYRGIRMAEDTRTQEGEPVCGRCYYKGHGRATCMRRTMTCRRCNQYGHIAAECELPYNGGQLGGRNGAPANAQGFRCYFCGEYGHPVAQCPTIAALKGLAAGSAAQPAAPRN